MHLVVFTR